MERLLELFPDADPFDLAVAVTVVLIRKQRQRRTEGARSEWADVMGYDPVAA